MFALATIWLSSVSPTYCEDGLMIEARIVETKYCREGSGKTGLHVRLELDYRNQSQITLLVPNFIRVGSYTTFRDFNEYQKGHREDRVVHRKPAPLELPDFSSSSIQPDPSLFSNLSPGVVQRRTYWAVVILGTKVRPGSDHVIQFEIDHWPLSRKTGDKLVESWTRRGISQGRTLLMSKVKLSPQEIHIDQKPKVGLCLQVD